MAKLTKAVALLALVALALAPVAARASGDESLTDLERVALAGVNAERQAAGLPPLEISPDLMRIARAYSRDMAERRFFNHQDPDGRRIEQRTAEAGIPWRNVGENIARNRGFKDPAGVVVREWMKSQGQRDNILDGRFVETGIGVWVGPDRTVYFTQIFLRRPQQTAARK